MSRSRMTRRKHGSMLLALAAAGLLAGASCVTDSESELHRAKLRGGQAMYELAGDTGLVAVLLFDPRLCQTCAQTLGDWVTARRSTPQQVRIVLSRQPTTEEQQIMLRLRLTPDGVLAIGRSGIAHEFLFRDGVLEAQRASRFTPGAARSPTLGAITNGEAVRR